ncbi:MAG: RDD family protein [Corynebacterium sp.]|nr:RDD family protein [Corynebacterium sp.]
MAYENEARTPSEKSTWLNGPTLPAEGEDPNHPNRWPGENLGLTPSGSGSLASINRRIGGLFVDWIIAELIGLGLTRVTTLFGGIAGATLIVWLIISVVSVSLFARTPGQAACSMGVARVDQPGTPVGVWRAIVRPLLTIFVLPAVIVDADGRGLHDRVTGTAVIVS